MTKRAGARAQDERVHLSQSIAIQKAERRAHAVQCNEWRARAEAMQSGVISKASTITERCDHGLNSQSCEIDSSSVGGVASS